jgi:hypothetical protein
VLHCRNYAAVVNYLPIASPAVSRAFSGRLLAPSTTVEYLGCQVGDLLVGDTRNHRSIQGPE